MSGGLNLAKRPFLNPRPVLRVAVALWVAGLVIAAVNANLYFSHFSGSSATAARQDSLEGRLEAERAEVTRLRTEVGRYDADWQNERAVFLNAKIAERSFSWSALFDRLGEAMPADVRVHTVSPQFGRTGSRSRGGPREHEVMLGLRGESRSPEVLLEFVDALFEHASFREPDLSSESLQDSGNIDYSMAVIYAARPPAVEIASEGLGDEGEEAASAEEPAAESADETTGEPSAADAEAQEAAEATP